MRKIFFIVLSIVLLLTCNVYALDTLLLDMRDKLVEESGEINVLMKDSRDVIVLNSLWNTCYVTVSQLNAYFFMVGIFNTIEEKGANEEALAYLERWLSEIKKVNAATINKLDSLKESVDARTTVHIEKIKILYTGVNNMIDSELKRISLVKMSLEER